MKYESGPNVEYSRHSLEASRQRFTVEVVEQLARDEPGAWEREFPHLDEIIRSFVHRYYLGASLEERADVVGAVYENLARYFDKHQYESDLAVANYFMQWLYSVIHHQIYNHARRRKHLSLNDEVLLPLSERQESVESQADKLLEAAQVRAAFKQLSAIEQERLLLVIDGYKHQQIAELQQVSLDTIKSSVSCAKKKLRKQLAEGNKTKS